MNINESSDCLNEYSLPKSPSGLSETEACRTIVSMLINQRKANLNLEQQLKNLQSSMKTNLFDENQINSFGNKNSKNYISFFILLILFFFF